MNGTQKRVYLVWDENLIKRCDQLPAVLGRASMVHELLLAYSLTKNLKLVKSSPASDSELKLFHSDLYISHLRNFVDIDEDYIPSSQDEEYGYGYDCPPISDMYNIVSAVAGSSITAAKCLLMGLADIAINWCGGWHHAHRFTAEGFCYVNDVVIAIEKLRIKFPKILYIDLDVHHGNGVQDAYNLSKSVFTLSFHKYEPGFYPGTGSIDEKGTLSGQGYTCNFPLHAAYSDDTFTYAFKRTFSLIYDRFVPDALVVQCGADALANDPNGGAGLTIKGYCTCVKNILDKNKPVLLLGGGGYNFCNAAKLWTSLTALAVSVNLDENIPEHNNWPKYGPDYLLAVEPLLSRDLNTRQYLDECIMKIEENLNKYLLPQDDKRTDVIKKEDVPIKARILNNKNTSRCNIKSIRKNLQLGRDKADIYEFNE